MRYANDIRLEDVQAVYAGSEGELWELIMGEQIHVGGFASSLALAEKAQIGAGLHGVDLCCCTGAGMRFLTRFRNVAGMTGVDATTKMIQRGRERCAAEGLADRIKFVQADVCQSGLPTASADFVWGEDAWCYVADKQRLIAEAARLVKPGGVIAFTDWVEGPTPLTNSETERYLRFMKFPSYASPEDYVQFLQTSGCDLLVAEDTQRFAPCLDLYLAMLNQQLTYDALKIIGFDLPLLQQMGEEMKFIQQLAHQGKVIQGMFVARRSTGK
jgi:ubiquinone/menaquinone biosynthesis C-methylase UbiE